MPQDPDSKRRMEELGRALLEAVGESPDVSEVVRKIQRDGFSLHLVMSSRDTDEDHERQIEWTSRRDSPKNSPSVQEPEFRINGQDVTFLNALGIDPTRSARRRRS